MLNRPFGVKGLFASELGLGCSRLGSVLGASRAEAENLLAAAYDLGVTYFDTSDLYGQGDSERMIGRVIGRRPHVIVATKVGKRHPLKYRLLAPLKSALAPLLKRSAAGAVKKARGAVVPTCFEPDYLAGAIDASLARLGLAQIDVLMLHSPSAEVLRRGEALAVLEKARAAGKVRAIGVAVDDAEAGAAAVADQRVEVVQIPLRPGDAAFDSVLAAAQARRVAVVAREIFGGAGQAPGDAKAREALLRTATGRAEVTTTLIGTTKLAHLRESVAALAT
jgi:aryl-alcohol dehydrogenase-like predicted oxidoreductase